MEQFVIDLKETKLFNPGIARKEFGKVDPNNPKTLIVVTHNIDHISERSRFAFPPNTNRAMNAAVHGWSTTAPDRATLPSRGYKHDPR